MVSGCMCPPAWRPQVSTANPRFFAAFRTCSYSPVPRMAVGGSPMELSLCSAGSMKLWRLVRATHSAAISLEMLVEKAGSSMS